MHETAHQPLTRRALREQERVRVPRRRRALGHAAPKPALAATPRVAQLKRKSRRPLTVAAFVFAIGLAITSVVPMLALGQSATAAAASAAGVQAPGQVQAWKASLADTAPQASRDGYSAATKPGTFIAGGSIRWPFPFKSPISYGFGPRVAPMEGASTFHKGVDFDPGAGVPIQIIAAGKVTQVVSNPSDSLGVHVVVDNGVIDGHHIESWYCEMAPGSIKVSNGQVVSAGDIVGNVGISGISTGAHLHFELHVDGTAVDPLPWLTAHAGQP
ncbi:M23 family metallopeptidase [Gryllotalpicola protaetiae]|uniref:M23 family metallopeptidase n=1 Tax=Gryllotalpicola protaetiae TaxID=2419771 RepID=A0A387BS33_9MICO|nr:M23 family metallopeptidase [Gryllotalpicola protaetiae]AYG03860.1 M23 family metallopeptidase [Gryllotalpicola protaetiae]